MTTIDRDPGTPTSGPGDLDPVVQLRQVAELLRERWATALQRARFDEIDRLAEASHSVHRALAALDEPTRIGPWDDVAQGTIELP
jgi:hypothetical protein